MIPIKITEDGVCTSGMVCLTGGNLFSGTHRGYTIGTPIANIKVALDLLITFRTPSYL